MPMQRFPLEKERYHDHFLHTFQGLKIKTDRWDRRESDRVLGLGSAVHVLMNYMANHPELVRGKRVFEPFAGSGPLGFLAVKLGATRVDLLDVNPRAIQFMSENAKRNGFDASGYSIYQRDIGAFQPTEKYDVLFANPPFVPVPDGIGFPIHSNGGLDGNGVTNVLLSRLNQLLRPEGQALLVMFQIEDSDGPTILHGIGRYIPKRPMELTRMRPGSYAFRDLAEEYVSVIPQRRRGIQAWSETLAERYGGNLSFNYYVIHIGRESATSAGYTLRDYDGEKYGRGFYNFGEEDNLIGTEIRLFLEK